MNFKPANIPDNDKKRVKAVLRTGVLDTSSTELYEIYCFLAKEITGCPVSWTGLIDTDRQFMLARDGFPEDAPMEMPRNQTLCQFAIEKAQPLLINDMTKDKRFMSHPAVISFGGRAGTSAASTGTSEASIETINKLRLNLPDINLEDAVTVLKFFINDILSHEQKQKMVDLGLANNTDDHFEISKNGKKLQEELNLNIGTLKRIKNLSNNEGELMKMFDQIES